MFRRTCWPRLDDVDLNTGVAHVPLPCLFDVCFYFSGMIAQGSLGLADVLLELMPSRLNINFGMR